MRAAYSGSYRARGRVKQGDATRPELAFRADLSLRVQGGSVLWFKEQPFSLRLAADTHYRPDFVHLEYPSMELVVTEIKAGDRRTGEPVSTDVSWAKLKIAAEHFPPFRFERATWDRRTGTFTVETL